MSQDPKPTAVGIIIRKDGTVPFDDDFPDHLREHVIRHLSEQGHTLKSVEGTRHMQIQNWVAPDEPKPAPAD